MMTLTLPFPPSLNHYYGTDRWGKRRLTAVALAYRRTVGSLCLVARSQGTLPKAPLSTRLHAVVHYHYPDKRTYDLDNPLKALQDSLMHAAVIVDDSQFDSLLVLREAVQPGHGEVRLVFCETRADLCAYSATLAHEMAPPVNELPLASIWGADTASWPL